MSGKAYTMLGASTAQPMRRVCISERKESHASQAATAGQFARSRRDWLEYRHKGAPSTFFKWEMSILFCIHFSSSPSSSKPPNTREYDSRRTSRARTCSSRAIRIRKHRSRRCDSCFRFFLSSSLLSLSLMFSLSICLSLSLSLSLSHSPVLSVFWRDRLPLPPKVRVWCGRIPANALRLGPKCAFSTKVRYFREFPEFYPNSLLVPLGRLCLYDVRYKLDK